MKYSAESKGVYGVGLSLAAILALGAACTGPDREAKSSPNPSPSCLNPAKVALLGTPQANGTVRAKNSGDCTIVSYLDTAPGILDPNEEFTIICVDPVMSQDIKIEVEGKLGIIGNGRGFSKQGIAPCPPPPSSLRPS